MHQFKSINRRLKEKTKWFDLNPVPASILPHQWRHWVLDPGSLTQRLIQASHNHFRVEVLHQGWSRPSWSEAIHLKINPRQRVFVREVCLLGNEKAWVYARTVIPESTMTGNERQLKQLKSNPLGAFLFKHKHMRRGKIHFSRLDSAGQTSWARRSLFFLSGKPLLVNEVFLPEIAQVTYPGT